jgi:hypothetical protein
MEHITLTLATVCQGVYGYGVFWIGSSTVQIWLPFVQDDNAKDEQ